MFMRDFKKKNYEVVRKAISKDMVQYLQVASKMHRECIEHNLPPSSSNPYPFNDGQSENSFSWYGPLHSEALLPFLEPLMSKVTGKKLLTSYSYTRTNFNCAIIPKHQDRESCEYSASLCIKKDVDWPFWIEYFENGKSRQVSVELDCGDMLVYKGDILSHWREEFTGKEHVQIFLHFVDSEGPYAKSNFLDGRSKLGLPHPKQPVYF